MKALGFVGLMIVLGPEKLLRFEGQGMALVGEIAILIAGIAASRMRRAKTILPAKERPSP